MPRKSTASNADGTASTVPTPQKDKEKEDEPEWTKELLALEDLTLPRSVVLRLAKGVLPANTQIAKDAQTALWKSATVFVSYLASNANENAMRSTKKTVMPGDVLDAMRDLEFEGFLPRLEAELKKYNTTQCDKRNSYRKKIRDEARSKQDPESTIPANGAVGADAGAVVDGKAEHGAQVPASRDDDGERATKKPRRSPGAEDDEDEDGELESLPDDVIADDDEDMEDDEGPEEEDEEEPARVEEEEDLLEEKVRLEAEDEAVGDADSD